MEVLMSHFPPDLDVDSFRLSLSPPLCLFSTQNHVSSPECHKTLYLFLFTIFMCLCSVDQVWKSTDLDKG